jgi:hypothetical protein
MAQKITTNALKKLIEQVIKEQEMTSREDIRDFINNNPDLNKMKIVRHFKNSASDLTKLKDLVDDVLNSLNNPIGGYTPDELSKDTNDHIKSLRSAGLSAFTKKELEAIAKLTESLRLTEDQSKFELEDIENYLTQAGREGASKIANLTDAEAIEKLDNFITNYSAREKSIKVARALRAAKEAVDAAKMRLQGLDPTGAQFKYRTSDRLASPTSIGGAVRSPADQSIFVAFETFFAGKNDLTARLTHLKEFSAAVVDAANKRERDDGTSTTDALNAYPGEIIVTGGNILSMLSKITREFDPSAAGFVAEGFLAYLVSGSKTGQKGGAGDFVDANGKKYSSKWGQTSVSQAASNFMNVGETITYITAKKTTEDGGGFSNTMSVIKVELLVYDVVTTKVGSTLGSTEGFEVKVGKVGFDPSSEGDTRTPKNAKMESYGSYNVSPPSGSDSYEIVFAASSIEIFDKIFNSAIKNSNNELAKIVSEVTTQMTILEDKSLTYSVSGDFTEAVSMADSYKNIEELLKNLYTEKTPGASASEIGLREQKITANFLKKLIDESFKK